MKELKYAGTMPIWIDCTQLGTRCKVGLFVEMTGPNSSYGNDQNYAHGPEITFRVLSEDNHELYTSPKRDATPYLNITDMHTAHIDTTPQMVINSILFDVVMWRNIVSVEQRSDLMSRMNTALRNLENVWPQALLSPPPSFLLSDLLASALCLGTAYHVYERREGASSIWLKRAVKRPTIPAPPGFAESLIIESRWTHVRNVRTADGTKKEFKESAVYETQFNEMPKTCEQFLSDMAVAATAAANFQACLKQQ